MKKLIALFMSLMLCMTMCLAVSAEDTHQDTYTESMTPNTSVDAVAASYPSCTCGGRGRTFHAVGSDSHAVKCRECGKTLVASEKCSPLSNATCTKDGLCICNRIVQTALGHAKQYNYPYNDGYHATICTRTNCEFNPKTTYGFTGPLNMTKHSYTPFTYTNYTHRTTGERWHKEEGTCTVCSFDHYDTARCKNQNKVCQDPAKCFS